MIPKFHRWFIKQYRRMPAALRKKCDERILLFQKDPFHPILENHPLRGTYTGYRSINITGDWRAVYRKLDDTTVYLVTIGTHPELYG